MMSNVHNKFLTKCKAGKLPVMIPPVLVPLARRPEKGGSFWIRKIVCLPDFVRQIFLVREFVHNLKTCLFK